MQVPLRRRSFGELIGLCFSLSVGNLGVLFLLAFLLNLPATLASSLTEAATQEPSAVTAIAGALAFLLLMLVQPLLQAATIRIVAGSFTGNTASLGESLRTALRKLLPLLGYGLLTGLIIGVGLVLCLVPGVIFVTWFYLGGSALVIEDLGVTAAMNRSMALGKGRRWEILGFALVTSVLFQGISNVIAVILAMVVDPRVAPWIGLPLYSLLSIPLLVAPVVYYFNLRVIREGFDVERMADLILHIGEGGAGHGRP